MFKIFQPLKNEEAGFTLIELLITLVVVVLALGGYVYGNSMVQKSGAAVHERSVATLDANRVAEQIRLSAATGLFPGNVIAAFPNNGNVAGFNNLTNEVVRVTYANTASDPLDVTITVSWLQNGRTAVSSALRILVTQRA